MIAVRALALLMLGGCTPFVGYQHLSQPFVNDRGIDLMCFGVKHYETRWLLKATACKNWHGGNMTTVSIEYDLVERDNSK